MIIKYTSMDALISCLKHNMVACLEKTKRNAQFHEIVDFLRRSSIYYSLTVSPTVSTSLIEQFWNTTTSKIVNEVSYIKAKVAGKTGMIRNLDAKKRFLMYPRFVQVFLNNQLSNLPAALDNLPIPVLTKKVFTNMAQQGLHFLGHVTPLFPNMLAQVVVDEGEDPRINLKGTSRSQGDHVQIPHDSPLSGDHTSDKAEGGLNLDKLHVLCTNLSNRILALETSKDTQAAEILKLKARIKKLEKKCKPSISHHKAWVRSVQRLYMKKKLGKKESVSKQGRKNAKPRPTLDAFDDLDADLAHGMDYMETEKVGSGEKGGSTVSTARPDVSTARPDVGTDRQEIGTVDPTTPPTTSIFDDEDITIAQSLIKMKEEKAKEKRTERIVLLHASKDGRDSRKFKEEWETEESKKISEAVAFSAACFKKKSEEQVTIDERPKLLLILLLLNGDFLHNKEQLKCRTTNEDNEVDYEILNKKYPIIEWKTEYLGTKPQFDETKRLEEINLSVQDWNVVSWKLHGSSGVHTLMTEARLVIHMLVEKKYPLRRKVLLKMLELKLKSEEDITMALELIRFVKKLVAELKPEDSNGNKEDL
ncbi:hypothetical protein Tco_0109075 [Tanacetum coccineum]